MRVCLVIQKFAGLRGGAERVLTDVATGLTGRGHDVTIATFEPSDGPPGYDTAGLPVVNLFPGWMRVGLDRAVVSPRLDGIERRASATLNDGLAARAKWQATHGLFARRLTAWLRRHPNDAVVGFMPPAISAVALAGTRLGPSRPRIIASTHNVPDEDFGPSGRWDQNPVTRRTNLWALEAVDAVTVLLPEFVDQLPLAAQGHAVVLPNPVTRLTERRRVDRSPRIVGVGRLTEIKRFDVLIDAFASIADRHREWDVTIHGDGPERDRLAQLAADRGVADRVALAGVTDDVGAVYDSARILVHPSSFEGFGLSVAEAILHELDVVASVGCHGVNQLVEDGVTGVLVDDSADAVAAFAAAIERLIDDPLDAGRRREGARRLADRFDPEHVLDGWERALVAT